MCCPECEGDVSKCTCPRPKFVEKKIYFAYESHDFLCMTVFYTSVDELFQKHENAVGYIEMVVKVSDD